MMPLSYVPSRRHGFTLIELLVTLTIAGVLAGLAVPNFAHFLRQIRLVTAVSELRSAIDLTRSEAIKRNGKVDLVAVNGNWANGWTIKSAENGQISAHEALDKDFIVSAKFTDGDQHISYNGSGHSRTKKGTSAAQFGHIQIAIGKNSRLIFVNFLGHVRVCNPAIEANCVANLDE